jgi:hypothetical protein
MWFETTSSSFKVVRRKTKFSKLCVSFESIQRPNKSFLSRGSVIRQWLSCSGDKYTEVRSLTSHWRPSVDVHNEGESNKKSTLVWNVWIPSHGNGFPLLHLVHRSAFPAKFVILRIERRNTGLCIFVIVSHLASNSSNSHTDRVRRSLQVPSIADGEEAHTLDCFL